MDDQICFQGESSLSQDDMLRPCFCAVIMTGKLFGAWTTDFPVCKGHDPTGSGVASGLAVSYTSRTSVLRPCMHLHLHHNKALAAAKYTHKSQHKVRFV